MRSATSSWRHEATPIGAALRGAGATNSTEAPKVGGYMSLPSKRQVDHLRTFLKGTRVLRGRRRWLNEHPFPIAPAQILAPRQHPRCPPPYRLSRQARSNNLVSPPLRKLLAVRASAAAHPLVTTRLRSRSMHCRAHAQPAGLMPLRCRLQCHRAWRFVTAATPFGVACAAPAQSDA